MPLVPLHVPAHVAWVPAQTGRLPRGVPVTVTHMPAIDGSLQDWHWPPHALAQHTPSTHSPLAHWPADWQGTPLFLAG